MYSETHVGAVEGSVVNGRVRPALWRRFALAALLIGCGATASAHDVAGVDAQQLDASYWIARAPDAGALVLDRKALASIERRLASDPSVNDLAKWPDASAREALRAQITAISTLSDAPLYGADGAAIAPRTKRAFEHALALDAIPARVSTRWGLVVRRAPLRAFPTATRVFSRPGDTDIDRFQENALFPGTPVAILHTSRDGNWWFVASPLYEAWIERRHVATGARDTVLGYAAKTPLLVVTGPQVHTVYTPEEPRVSELVLEMGVRVPRLADWPPARAVNGQHPYTSHVVELPVRNDDGTLALVPALVPRTADVADDHLPLTRATLIAQSFKFLGERYGWGHDYNARDCSGFVSEVYRSFGVRLPRNTRDQAVSRAYERIAFTPALSREAREAILRALAPGDLVYIPGHVMMVIGQDTAGPYVIHDTTGIGLRDARGAYRRVALNGVAVTPLLPLWAGETTPTIERITAVQRILPAPEANP